MSDRLRTRDEQAAHEEAQRRQAATKARHERIAQLARQGLPVSVIAERLGVGDAGRGNVEDVIRRAGVKVTPESEWLP